MKEMKSAFLGAATSPANLSPSLDKKSASALLGASISDIVQGTEGGWVVEGSPTSKVAEIVEGWAADLIRDALPAHHYSQFASMQDALPELIKRLEEL